MSNVEKIAHISLLNARNCLEARNYGRAFANFLLFLKLKSENSADVYTEFALATREWCGQLEGQNRLDDLFKCYDQACEMFPDHDVVLNNIGAQLFRLGYIEEAAAYIRKSLLVNPNYLAARDNLENVCSHLVERWHFAMLNDKRRNIAFKFAIDKAIKSGYNSVLDIGTGTGILSMMCEFSGALEVTACDGSRAMVDVARDVLLANGMYNKINLLHKHSTDIQVPTHLPSRVKLVVTETFDAGLFGEHIVSTLIHAWKNLISTSPMGTVIPCGATMYVCGIECETIRTQSRLLYPVLQYVDVSHVDLLCNTGHIAEEPYTTENLAKIRGGYKILTNIVEFLRVSFCNLCELESLHRGKDWLCDLYVKQSGRLDALAVWFDLHLDDTITIATGADNKSCWEQAIYPLTSVDRQQENSHENCHVKRKEKLRTTFHFERDCLRLTKCEVRNEQRKARIDRNAAAAAEVKDIGAVKETGGKKTDCTAQRSSGTSVKECSANCLPFRKRKVEHSESEDNSCSCRVDTDLYSNQTENELKPDSCKTEVSDASSAKTSLQTMSETVTGENLKRCEPEELLVGAQSGELVTDICEDMSVRVVEEEIIPSLETEQQKCCNNTCTLCTTQIESIKHSTSLDIDMQIEMEKCSLDKTVKTVEKTAENIVGEKITLVKGSVHGSCVPEFSKVMPSLEYINSVALASSCLHSNQKLTCYAEQADIEYVNDIQLNRQYCHKLETFIAQSSKGSSSLLCITPRLSFLGIQAVKMGYSMVTMAVPEEHHGTIRQVAALNGCKPGQVILMELSDLNEIDLKADVIVCDIVEPCGALRQQVLEDLVYHRVASLNTGGLILPAEVKVHGLFIESEELESLSHVTGNDKTLGFRIAEFINVFQMQNHMNIDLTTLSYTKLTDVLELLHLDLTGITMETNPQCLNQTLMKSVEVMTSGKVTALVYWFELKLGKDIIVSTLDSRCHWKQAGVIIKDDISIVTGQYLVTKITLQNSCLDVKIVQQDTVNGHV